MKLKTTLLGKTYTFGSIKEVLAKANEEKTGDILAGLAADGFTTVSDIVYIQRGYENFEKKLQGLGATIDKVSSDKDIQKFKLKVG